MAFWLGLKERVLLDKTIIDGTRGGMKAKFFRNRRIACNKDLNAKENSVELTVFASHKLI